MGEYGFMDQAGDSGVARRKRRTVSEKLEIVRLTLAAGASVAEIARAHEVNANQLHKWRRLFECGQLGDAGVDSTALLPVSIAVDTVARLEPVAVVGDAQPHGGGAIHIELSDEVKISVEIGADSALVRCVLECLRK